MDWWLALAWAAFLGALAVLPLVWRRSVEQEVRRQRAELLRARRRAEEIRRRRAARRARAK